LSFLDKSVLLLSVTFSWEQAFVLAAAAAAATTKLDNFQRFSQVNQQIHSIVIQFTVAFLKTIRLFHVSDLRGPSTGSKLIGVF
jgi:hypothetical protein